MSHDGAAIIIAQGTGKHLRSPIYSKSARKYNGWWSQRGVTVQIFCVERAGCERLTRRRLERRVSKSMTTHEKSSHDTQFLTTDMAKKRKQNTYLWTERTEKHYNLQKLSLGF